ncbi:AbfB domain-containing protein [Streptosporangiaceae bacterium NEAU-GS5]|nr:AbfB domain-containing protein [Streptosporangiaceae bacterium NEAU-GS5]
MKRQTATAAAGIALICGIVAPGQAASASSAAAAPAIFSKTMLASTNFPLMCVRHYYFKFELSRCPEVSDPDFRDFWFKAVKINGYSDLYRLQATNPNLPGFYLRHQNFRVVLSKAPATSSPDYALFSRDSAFYLRTGLSGSGISFESYNFRGWYIRHRNFHLYISKSGDPNDRPFKKDASFVSTVPID